MPYFVGIIDGGGDAWGVRFPDLPGCVGAGATPEAAITDAAQSLRDVLDYKQRCASPVPALSDLSSVIASEEIGEGEYAVLIPVMIDAGRTVRKNLTFDAGALEAIEEAAKLRGLTCSAFLASAAREKIEGMR